METRARSVIVGTFVIGLVMASIVFILWMSRFDFNQKSALYDVYFEGSVTGLRLNEDVRYHGIPIGSVREISVDRENFDRVRVRISIDDPTLIREDTVALIEAQGLTGFTYIQMQGGSKTSPVLKPTKNNRYPIIQSQPSKIEMLFSNAPLLLSSIYDLAEQLNDLFDEDNRANVKKVLKNVSDLSTNLTTGTHSLDALIGDLRGNLEKLTQRVDTSGKEFETTLASLRDVSQKLDGLLKTNQNAIKDFTAVGLPEISKLATSARRTASSVGRVADELNKGPAQFLGKAPDKGYVVK